MKRTEIPFSKFMNWIRLYDGIVVIIFPCSYTSMMIEIESFKRMKQKIL